MASFHWVRGHQDRNKEVEELPIEAQLNIGADALADKWQEEYYGDYHPIPYAYPACPAQLNINEHCVTSQYRHQLIRAYTEPRYIGYLQYRFRWSDETVQSIAWKSLSLAINRINNPLIMTKICNALLPTATTLKRWKW